jgi:putative acetyltransferase
MKLYEKFFASDNWINFALDLSVPLGHATYYPRFGYLSASCFGIRASFEVPDEAIMTLNSQEKDTKLHGAVQFAPEFRID